MVFASRSFFADFAAAISSAGARPCRPRRLRRGKSCARHRVAASSQWIADGGVVYYRPHYSPTREMRVITFNPRLGDVPYLGGAVIPTEGLPHFWGSRSPAIPKRSSHC